MPRSNFKLAFFFMTFCVICYFRASPEEQVVSYAIQQIRARYVEPVGTRRLVTGALAGCAAHLDQYCQYYDWQAVSRLTEEIDRQFGGIGIEVDLDPETKELVVVSPIPGGPAQKGGILAGDVILAIEGKETKKLTLEEATKLMRGRPGTEVHLQIRRYNSSEVTDLRLRRDLVKVPTLLGDRRLSDGSWEYFLPQPESPRLGYIRISSFAPETAQQFEELVTRLLRDGMAGLVLDLRNDPGGLLGPAIDLCDLLLPSGVIATTRGRWGEVRSAFTASGRAKFADLPLVVLVNQDTASAAEIVAACLQDHNRAAVVGQRTYGKGTVQELISLGDRYGVLKITTATYWRPSNRNINRRPGATEDEPWGVQPNEGLEVKIEGEDLALLNRARALRDIANEELARRWAPLRLKRSENDGKGLTLDDVTDSQLAKAVEVLCQQVAKNAEKTAAVK